MVKVLALSPLEYKPARPLPRKKVVAPRSAMFDVLLGNDSWARVGFITYDVSWSCLSAFPGRTSVLVSILDRKSLTSGIEDRHPSSSQILPLAGHVTCLLFDRIGPAARHRPVRDTGPCRLLMRSVQSFLSLLWFGRLVGRSVNSREWLGNENGCEQGTWLDLKVNKESGLAQESAQWIGKTPCDAENLLTPTPIIRRA